MSGKFALELCSIPTSDGRRLDAAHYRSQRPVQPQTVIVHVHGKGGNFYSGPGRFLPDCMESDGIDHLSINMRFHDLAYTRTDYEGGETTAFGTDGGMWECIADGRTDLRACTSYLREQGYTRIFLSGHSAGGFYVGEYGALDDDLAGRILLSPLQDHRFVLDHWFPEPGQLEGALEQARQMVATGRGHHLIPVNGWFYAISADTLIERAAQTDGVWTGAVNSSDSPLLMVWGNLESRDRLWAELFEAFTVPRKSCVVLDKADHFFVGFEEAVADAIRTFVTALD